MLKWIPTWAVPVLILFSVGTVWLRLAIVRTAYSINQTDRETEKARQNRELLQIKLAELRSPRRLEVLARTRYGLGQPRVDQVIHVRKQRISQQ
jgi:hypothetical protein